jgi:large subunit ribosomal protein L21
MYAIIETGGKQYKVAEGDIINIELEEIKANAKKIDFDRVLFANDGQSSKVGSPFLEGAKVTAKFNGTAEEAIIKGPKLFPMYFRRRKNSKKRIGHRQKYMQVTIEKIKI